MQKVLALLKHQFQKTLFVFTLYIDRLHTHAHADHCCEI